MNNERPTEDELQAFVDGVLDEAAHAHVEDYLVGHPEEAERIADYIAQRGELRHVLQPIAEEKVPPRLDLDRIIAATQANNRRRPWFADWRAMAAGLVLLLAGGASGWFLHGVPTPESGGIATLAREAADNYAVYGADHVRPVELKADARTELVKWVSNRLQRPISVPDLSESGYRFMGGRLVATAHGPAGLFFYDDDRGTRLAMLMRPMEVDKNAPMTELDLDGTGGVTWSKDGLGYSLVGPSPPALLHPLADEARRQIDAAI
ncbi:anti-sigma factor family protein [Labrys okinawensis]|uniref:anti-sigma factor family protein n=1 Tax=Labrys okinawensis TaxID=346911 RepID=UPI0039BD2C07